MEALKQVATESHSFWPIYCTITTVHRWKLPPRLHEFIQCCTEYSSNFVILASVMKDFTLIIARNPLKFSSS